MKQSHAVMPSSLAKALIAAGVKHYDTGGTTSGGIGGTLTPQSGFQATAPAITTQNLTPGIGNLENQGQNIYGQQQSLAQALLAQSQGQGPNPAVTALNNETSSNVGNTAALIAGARGTSANPGLTARLAAQAGQTAQQQAIGQSANLQAEQELGEEQAAGGVLGNEATTNTANQGVEQGAEAAQNSALTTGQLGTSQINAGTALQNASNSASTTGGVVGALGAGLASAGAFLGLSKGGKVPSLAHTLSRMKFAEGGIASYATPVNPEINLNTKTPQSNQGLASLLSSLPTPTQSPDSTGSDAPDTNMQDMMAGGQRALGEDSNITDMMAAGAALSEGGEIDFRSGGNVPGKAKKKGNSPENDTVPALLSPKEEVLPRSVTMAPDAPERAKRFVEMLQEKEGGSKGYQKVVKAKASLKDRVSRLEKLCSGGMAA